METKEAQCLFSKYIKGDSLLQLKNGKIIFYYFRKYFSFMLYNEKTFNKIYDIYLSQLIFEFQQEKEKENSNKKNKEEKEYNEILEYEKLFQNENKNSIKEISNGLILIGRNNYLIELKLKQKTFEVRIVHAVNDTILEINELSDKRLIVISDKNIILFNHKNEKYFFLKEYPIKENWKIIPISSTYMYFMDFHQYFSSEILPNNRLLLNSFSTQKGYSRGCGFRPPEEISNSKIIFVDLNNFEEIKSTKELDSYAKHFIIKNMIIIQAGRQLLIYEINSLELIKNVEIFHSLEYLYRYDEQYLLTVSEVEKANDLLIYKSQNNDMIEYSLFQTKIYFENIRGWNRYNGYYIIGFNNKFLLTLQDKRVIIICHNKIYVLKLDL